MEVHIMDNIKKTPVIVDFDPGLDDAVCLMMMLGSEQHDIIGLCPVSGNKGLHITEPNALKLLELCKRTDIINISRLTDSFHSRKFYKLFFACSPLRFISICGRKWATTVSSPLTIW